MAANSEQYRNRIDAINFSLAHDDGQFITQLDQADVILVGVSRCGKTPTSLYLAMQYAIKAANFPLTPDDFRSEEHTSELQSLMRISYAVFCLKKKTTYTKRQ